VEPFELELELLVFVALEELVFAAAGFTIPGMLDGCSEFKIVGRVKFAETLCIIGPPKESCVLKT
jgi:hypothetical protein